MPRIRRLDDDLINKIAAGEVVERPASVVKELVENAIDAGATTVRVKLAEGGRAAITVIDDGVGMSREDAVLSLTRHATSKLADLEGLLAIETKGFRGEALPSIASVSRFVLCTAEAGAPVGTRVEVEGGRQAAARDEAPVPGTRIDVEDLFFNVPARRKFLKREATELVHCQEAVLRLMLAHPEVGFFVEHGDRLLLSSPASPGDLKERVIAALGPEVAPHLLKIEERRLGVTVTGVVASPEYTLNTARGLYTFVNRRYIRDRGLTSAVQRAFQDSLPPGRQPVAAIFVEVDPRDVDVNVHPQKLEVRFADPRGVQETVGAAISQALNAAPWRAQAGEPSPAEAASHYAQAVERFLARAQAAPAFLEPAPGLTPDDGGRPAFGTLRPGLNDAPPEGYFGRLRFVGDLARKYWVCEAPGGTLVVVDPVAAAERVHRDTFARRLKGRAKQPSTAGLFSTRVELSFDDASVLTGAAARLEPLGVDLEPFGGDTLAVQRLPPELERADVPALLVDLAAALGKLPPEADPGPLLEVLADHAARGAERVPTHDEVRRLFEALDEADFSLGVRHGRVVLHEVLLLELDGRAGTR